MLSLLVMEDIVMALYLPLMAVLLVGASVAQGAIAAAIAIGVVAAALFISFRFSKHVSRLVQSHSRELLLLGVLGLAFLVAGLAEAVQVSAAVGAFLLGLTLSGQVADQVRALLPPLRDVFGGIFFVFFGIAIDPRDLIPVAVPALILADRHGRDQDRNGCVGGEASGHRAKGPVASRPVACATRRVLDRDRGARRRGRHQRATWRVGGCLRTCTRGVRLAADEVRGPDTGAPNPYEERSKSGHAVLSALVIVP